MVVRAAYLQPGSGDHENLRDCENIRFIFQSEFINVWNHPVWANPAGGYNSTSQGFIQNTSAPIQSATFGESSVVQADPGQVGLGARQIEFRANIEF